MTANQATKPKKPIDWEGMQPAWQAGIVPVLHLSEQYGVSRAAIHKHWDKLGIERSLGGQITAKANAIVARQEVAAKRLQEQVTAATDPVTEAETVATNAEIQANIILTERKDVQRLRALFNTIVTEMEATVLGEPGAPVAPPVLPIGMRLDQLRKASETFKTIVGMERLVNNIAEDTPIDPSKRVAESIDNGFEGLRQAFHKRIGGAK